MSSGGEGRRLMHPIEYGEYGAATSGTFHKEGGFPITVSSGVPCRTAFLDGKAAFDSAVRDKPMGNPL
jgi:hypothetical protein